MVVVPVAIGTADCTVVPLAAPPLLGTRVMMVFCPLIGTVKDCEG